jgi:hypothetical protein
MHWIDAPADLVADLLQREAGLPLVDEAAVHEQPGRLMHRHQEGVLIKNVQASPFLLLRTASAPLYHAVIVGASRSREHDRMFPPASDFIASIERFAEEWGSGLDQSNALTGSATGVARYGRVPGKYHPNGLYCQ